MGYEEPRVRRLSSGTGHVLAEDQRGTALRLHNSCTLYPRKLCTLPLSLEPNQPIIHSFVCRRRERKSTPRVLRMLQRGAETHSQQHQQQLHKQPCLWCVNQLWHSAPHAISVSQYFPPVDNVYRQWLLATHLPSCCSPCVWHFEQCQIFH